MIGNLRHRSSKRDAGVIAEDHDAGTGDPLQEDVFQPELLRLRVCPGSDGIGAETVDRPQSKGKAAVSETD